MAILGHDPSVSSWRQVSVTLPCPHTGGLERFHQSLHVAWLLLLSTYERNLQPKCYFYRDRENASLKLLSISIEKSLTLSDHTPLQSDLVATDVRNGTQSSMVWHGRVHEAHAWLAQHQTTFLHDTVETVLVVDDADSASHCTVDFEAQGLVHLLIHQNRIKVQDEDAIGRVETLKTILSELVGSPWKTVGDANLLSDYDRRRILGWNKPMPDAPLHMTIHSGVAAKVEENPDAPAIYAWDGEMTYRELDAASSRLASLLNLEGGSGPYDMVLFTMRKSKWALVAALAILKSGKAIVPTDPSWPNSRLDQIVEITGASLAVCDEETKDLYSADKVDKIVVAPSIGLVPASERSPHEAACTPSDLAFVLFSSGSTGIPKGMLRPHGTTCTGSFAHAKAMHLGSTSRVLQFANHVFDVAMLDFFTTLLMGACVCIPSEDDRKNNLAEFVQRSQANWALLTPTVAGLLDPSTVPSLRFVTLGGEAINKATLQRWLQVCRVGINYGSAEVDVTHARDVVDNTDISNVGKRLPSCAAYIVDPEDPGIVLPVGAVGELIISGPTMATEYLNAPTKTAEVFMTPPRTWLTQGILGQESPPWLSRIYRMGDLFRQRSDGSLEFVSRKDFQVKVNGQKVELSEIESKLVQHPAVEQCVVLYPDQGPYAKRLVAIVQSKGAHSRMSRHSRAIAATKSHVSLQNITEFLSALLPPFMLPTVLIGLQDMPYTPTMKIDRNRLKSCLLEDDIRSTSLGELSYVSSGLTGLPISHKESQAMKLSSIVADVVATRHSAVWTSISGHDNRLVDIGLDSAQTMRLTSMIYKQFGVKVPVERLGAKELTIRSLADLLGSSEINSHNQKALEAVEARSAFLQSQVAKLSQSVTDSIAGRGSSTRHVFLTGATGYLGVQILLHLLTSSNIGLVTVLVRGADIHQASERLKYAITAAGAGHNHNPTLRVWLGDLSKPHLGLSKEYWNELSESGLQSQQDRLQIDTIIHCGAVVDWNKSYDELEAANVTSTEQLLQLVLVSPQLRHLIFISGGKYPDPAQEEINDLEAMYADAAKGSGYAQSKFVAEQLVDRVRRAAHNKSIDIVDPAYLMGSRERGLANQDDYLWRIVWASVRVGAFNADEKEQWLFIAEADSVADRIVGLTLRDHRYPQNTRLRIVDGVSVDRFWHNVCSVLRVSLTPSPADVWLHKVKDDMDDTSSHLLWPLADILDSSYGQLTKRCCLASAMNADLTTVTGIDLAIQRNVQQLSNSGFFS